MQGFSYPQYADFDDGGPYNEPKRRRAIPIQIFIYDQDDKLIREHKKDFSKNSVRKWINNVLLWAVSKSYTVEIKHGR